jgi:hypothetical protein
MLAAVVATSWPLKRLTAAAALAAGGAAGFLATEGWWAWFLWAEYGNPFFPYFNNIFQSRFLEGVPAEISQGSAADLRYIPSSPLSAAAYPLAWAVGSLWVSSEVWFRDARWLLLLVLLLLVALGRVRRWRLGGTALSYAPAAPFVCIFFGAAFLIWLGTFGIQRYIVTLEMLSGVMLMLALQALIKGRLGALMLLATLSTFVIIWGRHADWGHVPFQKRMIPDLTASGLYEPGILFVMFDHSPAAFTVPALPSEARFVRIGGNMPLSPFAGIGLNAHQAVALHTGPVRSLTLATIDKNGLQTLANFGLSPRGRCRSASVFAGRRTLLSCDLKYAPPTPTQVKLPRVEMPCTGSCAVAQTLSLWN